ncbi:MAG: hypothetical protein HZA08_14450 [Nitrospirae bacterium]|nr:hypothetical protein [Nitrospirota bacterium]
MGEAITNGDENGIILRQTCPERSRRAQDDSQGVMVSLSNHDRQLGVFSGEPS